MHKHKVKCVKPSAFGSAVMKPETSSVHIKRTELIKPKPTFSGCGQWCFAKNKPPVASASGTDRQALVLASLCLKGWWMESALPPLFWNCLEASPLHTRLHEVMWPELGSRSHLSSESALS